MSSRCAVVVGFDRDPASVRALGVAADLAERLGADVHVVHAVDLSDYPVDPDSATWDDDAAAALAVERALADETLQGFGGHWTYRAVRGEPADVIASVADDVDALLVVIGARREGAAAAISHLVGPSVSKGLLGHGSTRPVLVVPRSAALS